MFHCMCDEKKKYKEKRLHIMTNRSQYDNRQDVMSPAYYMKFKDPVTKNWIPCNQGNE